MRTVNKIIVIIIAMSVLSVSFTATILARTDKKIDISSLEELINKLQKQIEELITKIGALRQARLEVKQIAKEIKKTLQLSQQLRLGMVNKDVKLLQEILATDPEIYPEGLITEYYGPLTTKAVKRFQKKVGLEQVDQVGPKTLSRINEILAEGAGESGQVPPGLLIAPAIRKKIADFALEPLPGQILPPGIAKKLETTTPSVDGVTPPVDGIIF